MVLNRKYSLENIFVYSVFGIIGIGTITKVNTTFVSNNIIFIAMAIIIIVTITADAITFSV